MVVLAFVQPVLAVDIGEILVGLVALIFVIIRQLLEANKNAGLKAAKPPVLPQPQAQNPNKAPGPAPAAGQQADPLRTQVEEFLRRAGRPAQPNQPRPASQIEMLVNPSQPTEERTIGQPLRQAEWRQTPSSSASPQSAAGTEKARSAQSAAGTEKARSARGGKSRKRKSVAEHVAEQVVARAESLATHASKLGQRIAAEDQQFDVQIKSKFDHKVGTLGESESSAAAAPAQPLSDTPASQIAAMLANPGGVRQAVILNEILRRPSDRW
jgi:hypothetical protein